MADATYGWPEYGGVGGLNAAALRATDADLNGSRAREELRRWRSMPLGAPCPSTHPPPLKQSFPFAEILTHYQSVGRIYADRELAGQLRRLHAKVVAGEVRGAEPGWLFAGWLPSTCDQDDGSYNSFLGKPLLENLHAVLVAARGGQESDVDASVDTLIAVLAADIALVEACALPTARDERRQRRRTLTAFHALTRCTPDLPEFRAAGPELAAADRALRDGPEAPGLATITRDAAMAVLLLAPAPVQVAVEVSTLPITRLHDEHMFLRCVQAFETLYLQVERHLDRARSALRIGDVDRATTQLNAATARISVTPSLYRILTTMPREVFAVIRGLTDGRSANQSQPYRRVEQAGPVLESIVLGEVAHSGAGASDGLLDAMRDLDVAWRGMKRTHWGITLKIIGAVPGTGGTSGASYLKAGADAPLFPKLAGEPADAARSSR
jgi:hypothetical protein